MKGNRAISLTPAAERCVAMCHCLAATSTQADEWASLLILSLLRDESLASSSLIENGITETWISGGGLGPTAAIQAQCAVPDLDATSGLTASESMQEPPGFSAVLSRAREIARRETTDGIVTSSVLLRAVLERNAFVQDSLSQSGVAIERILDRLFPEQTEANQHGIPVDEPLTFSMEPTSPGTTLIRPPNDVPLMRVIDAALNRCREGLRVLEDFARFVQNDANCTEQIKAMRHELVAAEKLLQSETGYFTLTARDTPGDVGTALTHSQERSRGSLSELLIANSRRVQESLRSLEEFGKLISVRFGETAKQLRYRSYELERLLTDPALHGDSDSTGCRRALQLARVYVLITEAMCKLPWQVVVQKAIAGGVNILQLREKHLNDRELLQRAQWMARACREAGVLSIINDRVDIAVAADANGVHVGQSELSVAAVRTLLKPHQIVGVSTHCVDHLKSAIADGADYAGAGPMFPSSTKSFHDFPGLDYLRQTAEYTGIPVFAIGGIQADNLSEILKAGGSRIAIGAAVTRAPNPEDAVQQLQQQIRQCSAG